MRLLLTSSFPMENNELIAKFIKKLGNNIKILYVAYSDNPRKYCNKVKEYGFTNIDFVNLKKGFNLDELDSYNVIINHGGNPFTIRNNIKKSGLDKYFLNAKPLIITTSGSSYVLSKNFEIFKILYPKMKGNDPKGLGLFPFEVIPHYQRYRNKKSIITTYSKGKKIYALPDGSAIGYDGKNLELIGNVKFVE